ncbi:VOC family protein [Chryseobacterium sp. POL2]|uniref:VOC family protein n=1 Tax=Chryseobacterium sp. POL2 TaxID=2713414 RepID=UPI0013E18F19|nr:VOC family protein [Chryseobacterium sp. POL2]QIG88914.1 VOC family protein [Chryseobacterium sp. POL2]
MNLGAFSISLSVKHLETSKSFYENLGFEVFAGSLEQHYLIMKNGDCLIGLFEAMFNGNLLTFNPGWDQNAQNMENWDDVRTIAESLEQKGLNVNKQISTESGPGSLSIIDPDGNMILIDQHRS